MQLSEWGEKTMIDNTNDKINNWQSDDFDEYVSSKYDNFDENSTKDSEGVFQDNEEVGKVENDEKDQDESVESFVAEEENFDKSQDDEEENSDAESQDEETETFDENQDEAYFDDQNQKSENDKENQVEEYLDDEAENEIQGEGVFEKTETDEVESFGNIVDEIEIDDVVDDKVRAYSESIREDEEEVVSQSEDETFRQKQEDELSEQEVVLQEDNSVQKEISDSTRNIVMQEEQPIPKEFTKQTKQDKHQTQPAEQEVQPTRQQIQQNQQIKQEIQQLKETSESKAQKYVKEVYRRMDEKRYNVISGKSRDIYDKLIALITDMYDGVYSKNKTFRYKRSEILEDFDVCLQSILLKVALSDDSFSESDARYISEIPCYGKIAKDISFNYFINCSQELRAKLYKIADEKSDKVPYAVMMAGGIDLNGNQGVTKFLVDGMVKIAFNCLYLDNDKVEIQSVKEAFRTIYVFINKQGIKLS